MTTTPSTVYLAQVVWWLLVIWGFVAALVVLWGLHAVTWPVLQRTWPRVAAVLALFSRALPLPCTHNDEHGVSVMYRERRKLGGLDVLHWVCARCGHAEPMLERTTDEHGVALATGRPSHEDAHAVPAVRDEPKLRAIAGGRAR